MKHDDVDDFNLLEDMIRKDITAVISVISTHFSDFLWRLDYKNRPDEILIDHFCQCCWVQCPFCKATCTNTIENHEEDHNVDFHRINGLNGFYYDETQNFCTEFCSSVMKSGKSFKSSENWIPFEKYKQFMQSGASPLIFLNCHTGSGFCADSRMIWKNTMRNHFRGMVRYRLLGENAVKRKHLQV